MPKGGLGVLKQLEVPQDIGDHFCGENSSCNKTTIANGVPQGHNKDVLFIISFWITHKNVLVFQMRDLMSWVCDMEETMCSEEPARSVSGAEALISKHNQHKAEIDTREDSVTQVAKAGRKLIQQSHYASTEVCSGITQSIWEE